MDRIRDLAEQAARGGYITQANFLSPAERAEAEIWLKKNRISYAFTGGIEGCERQVCFLLPDYKKGEPLEDYEIKDVIGALRIDSSELTDSPGHRDYLGSLTGLGLRRDQLGDILVEGPSTAIICLDRIIPFIENTLAKVGSKNVSITKIKLEEISRPEREVELLRVTAASPRLDKIAAGAFGISRTQMAEYIRSGAVMVDWLEETRPDREVSSGMTISLRGNGRVRICGYEGLSRKNRHIFIIERPV